MTCCCVGQVTLRSSDHDSCAKRVIPPSGRVAVATAASLSSCVALARRERPEHSTHRFWDPFPSPLASPPFPPPGSPRAPCFRPPPPNFRNTQTTKNLDSESP